MQLFTAQWCKPCKQLKQRLAQNGLITADLQIIDIDESPELAKGIRSVPCLKDGDTVLVASNKIYAHLKGVVDVRD